MPYTTLFGIGHIPRLLATVTGVCVVAGTTVTAQAPQSPSVPSASMPPAIPVSPDLVTVVPFQFDTVRHSILLQAEVDGHTGTFMLDTGSPVIVLNRAYLQPRKDGGIDTATTKASSSAVTYMTLHKLRIGTFLVNLPAADIGPPEPQLAPPSNAVITTWPGIFDKYGYGHLLGTVGLSFMEQFETIIDYVNNRLILIRLDVNGRRLIVVPAYSSATTMPLLPMSHHWWGVVARLGDVLDTLEIDTGNPVNQLVAATRTKLSTHLTPAGQDSLFNVERYKLDHVTIAGRTFDDVLLSNGDDMTSDFLNGPFLRQVGVVGFNLRTRQLIFYH